MPTLTLGTGVHLENPGQSNIDGDFSDAIPKREQATAPVDRRMELEMNRSKQHLKPLVFQPGDHQYVESPEEIWAQIQALAPLMEKASGKISSPPASSAKSVDEIRDGFLTKDELETVRSLGLW